MVHPEASLKSFSGSGRQAVAAPLPVEAARYNEQPTCGRTYARTCVRTYISVRTCVRTYALNRGVDLKAAAHVRKFSGAYVRT